jgi:alkylation response protein AidB-like acyl-CoA dehydrogenase
MKDYPVEKLMRDAKGTQLYHGQNQLLGLLVARDTVREWQGTLHGRGPGQE